MCRHYVRGPSERLVAALKTYAAVGDGIVVRWWWRPDLGAWRQDARCAAEGFTRSFSGQARCIKKPPQEKDPLDSVGIGAWTTGVSSTVALSSWLVMAAFGREHGSFTRATSWLTTSLEPRHYTGTMHRTSYYRSFSANLTSETSCPLRPWT